MSNAHASGGAAAARGPFDANPTTTTDAAGRDGALVVVPPIGDRGGDPDNLPVAIFPADDGGARGGARRKRQAKGTAAGWGEAGGEGEGGAGQLCSIRPNEFAIAEGRVAGRVTGSLGHRVTGHGVTHIHHTLVDTLLSSSRVAP